jgi:hypothetical protein
VKLEVDKPVRDPWVDTEPGIQTFSFVQRPFDVLLGTTTDGTPCTLVEGIEFAGTQVYAGCLLVGGHFERAADVQIQSTEMHLTHLEEWSQHSPFPFLPSLFIPGEGKEEPYKVDIAYQRKRLLGFELPSRSCRIEVWSGTVANTRVFDALTVKHEVLLSVDSETPRSLTWYRNLFRDCTRLFSFFAGSRVVRTKTTCVLTPADENPNLRREVELYDQRLSPATEAERHPVTMPLPLPFVAPVAPQVFDKWFSVAEELAPVHQILMEVLPPSDLGLEGMLLRLAQALEVFYRRSIKETYVGPEEWGLYYQKMLERLPEKMPEALKDRLRNHLWYGNEFSLYSVVKRLIKGLEEPAQYMLGVENISQFAQLVANTRNSLTHNIRPDGPFASTARDYIDVNKRLRALLYAVVAQFLGFNTPAVVRCIENTRRSL